MAPAMAPRVLLWLTVLRLAPSTESVRAAVPWNIVEMRIGCPTPDGMGLRSGGMVLQPGDKATAGMGALLGSLPRKAPSWVAVRVGGALSVWGKTFVWGKTSIWGKTFVWGKTETPRGAERSDFGSHGIFGILRQFTSFARLC